MNSQSLWDGGLPLGTRWHIAKRELSSLSREKTIVLALVIQLFVAAFSSFLVVGLAAMYEPSGIGGNVDVGITGEASDAVVAAATSQGVSAVTYTSTESAMDAFNRGRIEALIEAERVDGRIAVTATIPENSLRKTLIVAQVRSMLEALERSERFERSPSLSTSPLPLPPEAEANSYFGFAYTVLLPLLVFVPAFVSGSIAVDAVTEEIEHGTLELLRVAPVSLVEIVEGKGLAMAILVPAQVGLWLVLLGLNGIAIANVGLIVVLASGFGLGLVGFGLGLGFLLPNRQRAQLVYSVGVLWLVTVASLLPEHPVTTVARLAIDSPGPVTRPLVFGYVVGALALVIAVRRFVNRVAPESLTR